ncbi:hypothetical protein [Ruminiclostridium cellulolyticum]|uniref:Uncharacterized protein n=1 Tax=Ruminiclostridium cellulolyticum (strain ATCC 35319 / DSM 5812 / JCM 6584 / H10) TaxID=394503 RepID=B8I6A6_RUMCH|nr:hypothetical protein [Ruminiclostridium cellulolyticum]ACL76871.1 hypothetical protein Ccel_2543 [Ruminiclostridium cellulolyticum H10]
MKYIYKSGIIVSLFFIILAITTICIRVDNQNHKNNIIGGSVKELTQTKETEEVLSRQTVSIMKEKRNNFNETYFRPSSLKSLNNNFIDFGTFSGTFKAGTVPADLMDTPIKTIVNYFSVLQQAENLTDEKKGGCGTVGYAKKPYPIAYQFLSESSKKSMPYNEYLDSFQGIGHINLIKVIPIITENPNENKYFLELEILEGTTTAGTSFNYYFAEISLVNSNKRYYIDSLELTSEDFFCAPYHGWSHNAESYVEIVYGNWCGLIKKQYAPHQNKFTKEIIVDAVNGDKYMFKFAKLTNGTDFLINTLVQKDGAWIPIHIDIDKYIDKNV